MIRPSQPRQTRFVAHGDPEEAALASWSATMAVRSTQEVSRAQLQRPTAPGGTHRAFQCRYRRAQRSDWYSLSSQRIGKVSLWLVALVTACFAFYWLAHVNLLDSPADHHPSGINSVKGRF